jgi:hypothetical protein
MIRDQQRGDGRGRVIARQQHTHFRPSQQRQKGTVMDDPTRKNSSAPKLVSIAGGTSGATAGESWRGDHKAIFQASASLRLASSPVKRPTISSRLSVMSRRGKASARRRVSRSCGTWPRYCRRRPTYRTYWRLRASSMKSCGQCGGGGRHYRSDTLWRRWRHSGLQPNRPTSRM